MMNLMWKNKKLSWTNELSVGNAVIDAEHKNLINMVNDVAHAIRERDCSAIAQAFEILENWLHVHFLNEEQIALAVKFDFSKHKAKQQYGLKELQHMRDELVGKRGVWSDGTVDHFTRSLKRWMIDKHIIELDMQMKPVLEGYPYDFMPA
ncbi:MAG: hemerythrin family protein [Gallionella sp.]|nr:hemerythrin family protein [Gallionella sp.]